MKRIAFLATTLGALLGGAGIMRILLEFRGWRRLGTRVWATSSRASVERPLLEASRKDEVREGEAAVKQLVIELERGLEADDAELTDRRLAENVMWGSPFGARVDGYGPLHAIHERFRSRGVAKGSHYHVERVLVPRAGVAIAHVRRDPSGRSTTPVRSEGVPDASAFSELALYVLVRHREHWWVVAGHNTPARPS